MLKPEESCSGGTSSLLGGRFLWRLQAMIDSKFDAVVLVIVFVVLAVFLATGG